MKEMGVSQREFYSTLPRVLAGHVHERTADAVVVAMGKGKVHISVGPESERRIASLAMPPG